MTVSLALEPIATEDGLFGVERMPDGSGRMLRFIDGKWVPDETTSFGEFMRRGPASSSFLKSMGAEGTFEVVG